MKVTIDTKEDSHEDIQKVLHLLTNIISKRDNPLKTDSSNVMNMFDNSSKQEKNDTTNMMNMFTDKPKKEQDDSTNMMSMFANTTSPSSEERKVADTPPDFTALLNLTNKEEKKDNEEPKVEFFN